MAEHQTLTRADLCEAVHEEVGLSRQECSAMVERTLELIAEALERGETVKLSGFGVFQVKPRKRGIGRNPRTGKEVRIPPGRTIRFKPGKELQNIG